MRFNKAITGLLLVTVVVLLVVLAFHVRIGATADAVAVLKTTGMTCGSCASKISRALESQRGVAVTEVDLEGGWVVVGYDAKSVQPQSLAEKVKGTGFGSTLQAVLTPEQFRQMTGRAVGQGAGSSKGCCGGKDGCAMAGK